MQVAITCILMTWLGAIAQQPGTPSVRDALDLVRRAYQTAPITEEVSIRLHDTESRSALVVTTVPQENRLHIVAGSLEFDATPERVVAAHELNEFDCFVAELDGLSSGNLSRVLPPFALPQIELAFGTDADLKSPVPWVRNVAWSGVERRTRGPLAMLVLSGRSGDRNVSMTIDAATGALAELVMSDPSGASMRLVVQRLPLDHSRLRQAGRDAVGSLAQLRARIPMAIRGDPVPDLTLLHGDAATRPLSEVLRRAEQADFVVLLMFLADDAGVRTENAIDTAYLTLGQMTETAELRTAVRVIPVFDAFDSTELERYSDRWGRVVDGERVGTLYWASGQAGSLRRFVEGADAAAVFIDERTVIRAILPLSDEGESMELLRERILDELRGG